MANCKHSGCGANATKTGYCYWHDPAIPEDEKQRARVRGGRSTRKIEPWAIPEDLEPISDLAGLKNLYNSALRWLTSGQITPSQAHSLRALAAGLRDCFELEIYAELVQQRRELIEQAAGMGIQIEMPEREETAWLLSDN